MTAPSVTHDDAGHQPFDDLPWPDDGSGDAPGSSGAASSGDANREPAFERVTEVGGYEVVDGGQRWVSLTLALIVLVALMWMSVDAFSQRLGVDRDLLVPDIEVQDFSGQGLADAQREVEASGLVATVEFQANDLKDFPPGTIFTQRPLDGTKLPTGSRVTLIASSGPSQFVVPDVTGQELGEAEQLVVATGLAPKAVPEYSDTVRLNEVVETRPRLGTEVAEGTEVQIVVSAGYAPRKVPKMVDKSAEEALNLLGRSGLSAGDIQTVFRRDAEEGMVVEISPAAGTVLSRNSKVDVIIAGPPPTASVPSVEGLARGRAEGELADSGLEPRVLILKVPLGSPDDGRVISQGVPPQTQVDPGFEVELIVGKAPPPPTTLPPTTVAPVEPTEPAAPGPGDGPDPDPTPTSPPATDPPATDPPATDPPATDPPATDPPATDPPVTDDVPVGGN